MTPTVPLLIQAYRGTKSEKHEGLHHPQSSQALVHAYTAPSDGLTEEFQASPSINRRGAGRRRRRRYTYGKRAKGQLNLEPSAGLRAAKEGAQ